MIPDTDPFAPLLQQFLNVNYAPQKHIPDNPDYPKIRHPLDFFDRHIASTLALKSIKHAPWIPKELGRICEDSIKSFTASGHHFKENVQYWKTRLNYPATGRGSQHVAQYHLVRIAHPCNAYASKLLFHPDDTEWFSLLESHLDRSVPNEYSFNRSGDTMIIDPTETDTGKKEYDIPPPTRRKLEDWVIPTIDKFDDPPTIFNYEFYINAKRAEVLLEKMGPCARFKWEVPTAAGAPTLPESPPPPDSPIIGSLFPSLGVLTARKPPSRKTTKSLDAVNKKRRLVAPLQSTQGRESQYRLNADHFIQKAWVRAVEENVTFIVFNCGRLERIGIRHRESQTLYLSDLIDPARWNNPGYGQLHLGLVLAATQDRLSFIRHTKTSSARPPKRKEPPVEPIHYNSMKDKATRRKRRKLSSEQGLSLHELDKQAFNNELAQRDLVLLYLNYSTYQSPVPSSFRRMEPSCASKPFNSEPYNFKRRPAYPPDSYISVTANQEWIGYGSLGVTYKVTVEIEMTSGSKHQRNLILKLAINANKEQIIREYELYKRLADAGVTYGIVGVHGLFHDMESGAIIMIMDDAGMTLRQRAMQQGFEIDDYYDSVETTEEECDAFVKVLEGIHSANIFHQDLRIDNLMINEDGEVFIIDFDSGIYLVDPIPNKYKTDMIELTSALGWPGNYSSSDEEEE